MVKEATVICIDNSEWSRNGDYSPSRFESQKDCANIICGSKMQMNPENSVGILTMANDRIDVKVSPTEDLGQILSGLQDVKLSGEIDLCKGLQTAQLALKHRVDKSQQQRIVAFVGSPINIPVNKLETLGRMLKKNSVALDIVSFGHTDANSEALRKLHAAVNSGDTSHILECTEGMGGSLADLVMSSSILIGESARPPGFASSSDDPSVPQFAGVDPTTDPELYMVLRMSLEEERARQARAQLPEATEAAEAADTSTTVAPQTAPTAPAVSAPINAIPTKDDIEMMVDIDEDLRAALLESISDFKGVRDDGGVEPRPDEEVSVKQGDTAKPTDAGVERFSDPSYVRSIIESVPGVDLSDPRIKEALGESVVDDKDASSVKDNKEGSDPDDKMEQAKSADTS